MDDVEIREARLEDAAAILAHSRRVMQEPDTFVVTRPEEFTFTEETEREFLQRLADHPTSRVWVAVRESASPVVGLLLARGGERRRERHVSTVGISVDQGFRNRGIGRRLLEGCITWARDNPELRRLELRVIKENLPAVQLYLSCGFSLEGERELAYRKGGRFHSDYMMAITF